MARWKAWAAAAVIFVAGVLTGVAGTALYHKMEHTWFRPSPQAALMKKLDRDLSLSPDQRPKIEAIVEDVYCEFVDLRNSTQPEVARIVTQGAERMREILRPDQRDAFNNILSQTMKRWGGKRSCDRTAKKP